MSDIVKAWSEHRAPPNSEIMMSYKVMDPLRYAKVCKRGCCIDTGMGPQWLPAYWRFATESDRTSLETHPGTEEAK